MANTIIHAISINLQAEYADDATIGLYTYCGVSVLNWSEATITGVAYDYSTGMLLRGGIGTIQAKSDLSRGGNIAQYSGFSFKVANAEKLSGSLVDLGIYLVGLPIQLIRYEGTEADSDSVSTTSDFTGIIESTEWNETELVINCKNSRYKRNAVITTTNTDGITTPVTFGSFYPPDADAKINNLAKFVKTIETTDNNKYDSTFFCNTSGFDCFPIVANDPDASYYYIATPSVCKYSVAEYISVSDCFCIVIDGGTGQPNQIKEVASFFPILNQNMFLFVLKNVFEYPLSYSGANRAWVRFIEKTRFFESDIHPCKSFLNKSGSIASTPETYAFNSSSDSFNKITDYNFSIDSTDNNTLKIDGNFYSNDFNKIESFNIYPITSLTKSTASQLNFNGNVYTKVDDGSGAIDGVYAKGWNIIEHNVNVFTATNLSDTYDREKLSYAGINLECSKSGLTSNLYAAACFDFDLPNVLDTDFNSVYIGLKMQYSCTDITASGFEITLNSFGENSTYEKTIDSDREIISGTEAVNFDNFPDTYWIDGPYATTNNRFYINSAVLTSGVWVVSGYTKLEISANDLKYKNYVNGTIKFQIESTAALNQNPEISVILTELAIIIKKSDMSVDKQIYTPFQGRKFNNTFDGRKTATALIENPIDIIEHCKRLQNWSEISGHTPIAWGKTYSADARIKLTGEGSFDSTTLDYLKGEAAGVCAFQVFDEDKAATDVITKAVCDTYNIGSYIDNDGYECLETIDQLTAPADSITLADIIGDIGSVTEPNPANVYAQPIVKYLYNVGSDKYDAELKVTDIDKAAWLSSYTPGYTAGDGETVWGMCKVLYNKYRIVEPCSNDFSERLLIRSYHGAVDFVKRKILWMDKYRVSINIPYSKGKGYNIFRHVYLNLPWHTNGKNVECIIENITKNKNSGIVSLDLVILENIETAWFNNASVGPEYQDNASTGNEYNAR